MWNLITKEKPALKAFCCCGVKCKNSLQPKDSLHFLLRVGDLPSSETRKSSTLLIRALLGNEIVLNNLDLEVDLFPLYVVSGHPPTLQNELRGDLNLKLK